MRERLENIVQYLRFRASAARTRAGPSIERARNTVKRQARRAARQYHIHREKIDPALLYTGTGLLGVSVIDDYTAAGLVGSAAFGAIGIGVGLGSRLVDDIFTVEGDDVGAKAAKIAGLAAAYTLEAAVLTAAVTDVTVKNVAEMLYLQIGAYGAFEATRHLASHVRTLARGPKQWMRRASTAALTGLVGLGVLGATQLVDYGTHDGFTGFDKEGIRLIDTDKLEADGLTIERDWRGEYVPVTLDSGEAMYTSVVLAYTDALDHDDVMDTARRIGCYRSLECDLEDIHPGDEIKIPISLLARRYDVSYKRPKAAHPGSSRDTTEVVDGDLSGKHIILDAGHGGNDPGSGAHGVVEDEVSYDIMVRAKRELEARGATVHVLVEDKLGKDTPQETLTTNTSEYVMTNPTYLMRDTKTSLNLRVYKTAAIYENLIASGVPSDDIVFTSFHSDALNEHAQGIMVYAHFAKHRYDEYDTSDRYDKYEEARQVGTIEITEKKRGERLSFTLADLIVGHAPDHDVAVHGPQPVRGEIRRGSGIYRPLVITANPVPTSVLVEVGNCNNSTDADRMLDPTYRQQVAETYATAVTSFFGGVAP